MVAFFYTVEWCVQSNEKKMRVTLVPAKHKKALLYFKSFTNSDGVYRDKIVTGTLKSRKSYIEKDVRNLYNLGDLHDFRRLIQLLAANTSQILDLSHYANQIGVAVNTIKRWITVLQASYIIFLLPPFYQNLGKRISKLPKIYFYDTGIVAYLTGIETKRHFENGPMTGALFENYIISETYKNECHRKSNAQLYYYRTSNGLEVDLIIDRKQYKELIEIKYNSTFKVKMIQALKKLRQENDRCALIYNGKNDHFDDVVISNYGDWLLEDKLK